jgi:hypothetical protein
MWRSSEPCLVEQRRDFFAGPDVVGYASSRASLKLMRYPLVPLVDPLGGVGV